MMNPAYSPMVLRPLGREGLFRVNWPFTEMLGLSAEDLRQKPLLDCLHEEDRARFDVAARACQAGQAFEEAIVARHYTEHGSWVELQWRFQMHAGECIAYGRTLGEAEPVRPAVRARQDDAASLAETLDAMARVVEANNPGMLCSILLVDDRGEHIVGGAGPSLPAAYNKSVEGVRIGPAVGSCGTAVFWNAPIVVENIQEDPLWRDLQDAAKLAGVASCWSYPIVGSHGRPLGAMALYDTKPRAPER